MTVRLAQDYPIIIRKESLQEKDIDNHALLQAMETDVAFDEDSSLFSFGPHFGGEASTEFCHRLDALGLEYGKDYYPFTEYVPPWIQLFCSSKEIPTGDAGQGVHPTG